MKKDESVSTVAFFNILSTVVLTGVNFLAMPILTRIMSVESYGTAAIYATWVSVLTVLIGIQIDSSLSVAHVNYSEEDYPKYVSSVLSMATLSFCCWIICTMLLLPFISKILHFPAWIVVLMILQSFASFIVQLAVTKLLFDKQSKKMFALSVTVSLIGILLSVCLLYRMRSQDEQYVARILGVAAPVLVLGIVLFFILMRRGKCYFSKEYWGFCLPYCLPVVLHTLSHLILSQSDKIMLGYISGEHSVGIYSLAVSFAGIVGAILTALNNSWVPFYYDDLKAERHELIQQKSKNYIELFTILMVGFILLSPEVFIFVASEKYCSGISLIPILVLGTFCVFLYQFPVNFQLYHRSTKMFAMGTVLAAVSNILLNSILIPIWDIYGAAFATLLSYLLLFVFHYLIVNKMKQPYYGLKLVGFAPSLLAMILACVLFYTVSREYWLVRWIIATIVGVYELNNVLRRKTIF